MHRILEETIRITADERDYNLSVRLSPVSPSLRGQYFAAKPTKLFSLHDRISISISRFLDSFGATEQDAVRGCVEKVQQFLSAR